MNKCSTPDATPLSPAFDRAKADALTALDAMVLAATAEIMACEDSERVGALAETLVRLRSLRRQVEYQRLAKPGEVIYDDPF